MRWNRRGIPHPGEYPEKVTLLRCPPCGERNVLRVGDFTRVMYDSALPAHWNFDWTDQRSSAQPDLAADGGATAVVTCSARPEGRPYPNQPRSPSHVTVWEIRDRLLCHVPGHHRRPAKQSPTSHVSGTEPAPSFPQVMVTADLSEACGLGAPLAPGRRRATHSPVGPLCPGHRAVGDLAPSGVWMGLSGLG
jgi:hypothetical protein